MGTEHTFKQVWQLLGGRWQVPLAMAAAVVGSVALFRLMPSPPPASFDALLADVAVPEQAGDTLAAADAVANLLQRDPPLPPAQQAVLHSRLAELIHRAERGRWDHNLRNVKQILEHDRAAAELGYPLSPDSMLRDAQAQQWLGEEDQALRGFRAVLAQELSPDQRRTTVQALAELLEKRPEAKLEWREMLGMLLSDGAFAHSVAGDRAAWERFLSMVLLSDLFRDAFAAAR